MKILHPTDFSRTAEHARTLALDLSDRLGATLHVVYVQEKFMEGSGEHTYLLGRAENLSSELLKRLEESREEEVKHIRQRLERLTPEGSSSELRWGKTVPELLELSKQHDLIVMGAHGANRLDNYFLGGTAGRIARRSNTPILSVRDEAETTSVRRILVATDFGTASRNAWEFARSLAEHSAEHSIEIAVAHVTTDPDTSDAVTELDAFTGDADVRKVIRAGNPVDALPNIAREIGADVIAIGIWRHAGPLGLVLGSQADALLRSSPVPILSVPGSSS
ncbi:MAG: universal stress protein [Trueperaceae bacterium]|nr:universal stress protein [Trueperaceae bacterium]